uniref:Uncharacterized protein n=1 Tax=Mimiviridae sp. ChoanoV1 TaxID=2596887 RepID=A0A5B8IFE7_9VIRU|nr:hypothetical protein 1_52 [Mimiviridae sp. ChoanoV1]
MISDRNKVNYLTIILCIFIIILLIIFKKDIELNQIYITGFILLIIILSTIFLLFRDEKENFEGKVCFNRSKEYLDYKNKIFNRIKVLKEIEEKNRMFIKYDDEIVKLEEMDKLNQDYLANGELF